MKPLWLVGLLALGCAPKEVNYSLNIVTQNCEQSANPFDGVQFLRMRITGEGMETRTEVTSANPVARELKIPEIPAGKDRLIEVRGYDGDPASGGRVISIGQSVAFTVPATLPEDATPVQINVILRKVNTFSPIVSAASTTQCQHLTVARAAHTATLLKNGKVFLSGGYNLKEGTKDKQALAETELYNPGTGAFEKSTSLSIATTQGAITELPRAHHAAIGLPNGQVLVWGGEIFTNNVASPIASIIVYDPDVDNFGGVALRIPSAIARSHHQLAIDVNGKVLVVGGTTRAGVLVNEVEWFDPNTNLYKIIDGVMLPRLDATVMSVKKGDYIVVAGGSDGEKLVTEVAYFKFAGSTFGRQQLNTPPELSGGGRRSAAGAVIRSGADLLLLGGYSDPTMVRPLQSSEVLNAAAATVTPGPDLRTPKGDACAISLSDGSVLAMGGRTAETGTAAHAEASSVLLTPTTSGAITSIEAPSLPTARYQHTCTTLVDGTVLVTGGVNERSDGSVEILNDAYIYTPTPAAD